MPNRKVKGAASEPKEFDPREHPDFHTREGKEYDPHKQPESKRERDEPLKPDPTRH